ncbi:MAG: hypothetical protein EBT92_14470 [Planctomycetes bacterium]|nr:hypothetical protein [Planctomycetota bacterium]
MNELVEMLKKLTKNPARCDSEDFMVNDDCGGNVDDAYQIGYDDGQTHLAETVLAALEKI